MMFDASKLDSTQSVQASVLKNPHHRSQSQLTNDVGGIYIRDDSIEDNNSAKLDVSDLQVRNLFTESYDQAPN